jgi:hypothetical protein
MPATYVVRTTVRVAATSNVSRPRRSRWSAAGAMRMGCQCAAPSRGLGAEYVVAEQESPTQSERAPRVSHYCSATTGHSSVPVVAMGGVSCLRAIARQSHSQPVHSVDVSHSQIERRHITQKASRHPTTDRARETALHVEASVGCSCGCAGRETMAATAMPGEIR